jgi:ketosteroid isomerase-like protein
VTEDEYAKRQTLERFFRAWLKKDVASILGCMTDDCIYGASVGPEPGLRYQGKAEVRAGIEKMLAHDQTVRAQVSNVMISGQRAVWEWQYVRIDEDGVEFVDLGCDLIWFEGDKISVKQAFRKVHEARAG